MAYIGNAPGVSSQRTVSTFTATAGQTTFTPTSGYTPGYVDVYHNGVKLIIGDDYTASNGTSVVLTAAASADDVVECVAYLPRGLSDGYTKAEADARYEPIDSAYTKAEADARYDASGAASTAQTAAQTYAAGLVDDLSGVTNASTARSNLGLGSLATKSSIATADITDGAVTAAKLAAGAAVPSQSGQSGKYLTTNGTTASWGTITAPTPAAVSDQANTSTGYFDLPAGTTAQRPASPSSGMVRFNTTYNQPEWYDTDTSQWVAFGSGKPYAVEVLMVAGGGGGPGGAGAGGAGGLLYQTANVESDIFYTATVGSGGAAGGWPNNGSSGTNSTLTGGVLSLISAIGGGYGSHGDSGGSGGSGGGAGYSGTGGSGTSGQGNAGGTGNNASPGYPGGGGGGAGAAGGNASGQTAGNGGAGSNAYATWATATSTGASGYYAGGGGGNSRTGTSGTGGAGGGGNGATGGNGGSGAANTGGGGGGGATTGPGYSGGNGGSGIVIIRYLGSQRASGGTVVSSGGYTYHTFKSTGQFVA